MIRFGGNRPPLSLLSDLVVPVRLEAFGLNQDKLYRVRTKGPAKIVGLALQ